MLASLTENQKAWTILNNWYHLWRRSINTGRPVNKPESKLNQLQRSAKFYYVAKPQQMQKSNGESDHSCEKLVNAEESTRRKAPTKKLNC